MTLRGVGEAARYGLPGLFLGVLLMGGAGGGRGAAGQVQSEAAPGERARMAAAQAGDGSGILAFTAPTAGTAQLLYLIDTRSRAFTIYRIDPANPDGTVKLVGARQYQWDLKLSHYNNQQPDVPAVEAIVKTAGRPIPNLNR